ncbi:PepSY domain-containing protein [Hyphomicrobium sp. LHD-15]|uniref:PepSY domain-containing protein n=1 Tax=Hyphomicrobium sp. LHD-15 TaxID=3072142 RepID=UPI002810198A|nr:PepSY domain-containing protein [Hyphomicrobium sp. LHD-15]MDQ8698711.1 PepSY domain-containing protein [Hyphomicrobium sp. LHD-15]
MKKILAASVLSFAFVAPAFAGDDYVGRLNVPRDQWLSVPDVIQKIEAQGYKVHEIEADDGAYEFEGTTAAGVRVEAHVHPATGELLKGYDD